MSVFKFRAELCGHTGDVRGICACTADSILSASRDFSVRLWKLDDANASSSETKSFTGHTSYVTSVIHTKPTNAFPNGLIITGSNDRVIRVFTEDQTEPIFALHGHNDTVCSLDSNEEGLILSGSWDSTAKLWDNDSNLCTIKLIGVTIWSAVFIEPNPLHPDEIRIATGSSDSVIGLWHIPRASLGSGFELSNPTQTLIGHTDCIRSLAVLDANRLLSASNDGSLRCWRLSNGSCVSEFYGHTSFVYSVAVDPAQQFIVSSSEDRTVRVWPLPTEGQGFVQQLECQQTLFLPCQTAWCAAVMADGDIVVGCSDKKIRLFSRNPARQACGAALETYETELSSYQMAAATLGDMEKQNLPGIEALTVPGRSQGQVMVVREDTGVMCYQWSAFDSRWVKVGDVVGSVADSASGSNRTLYEGKEFDYVFTVDFDESKPPVKLPYNKTDDPWFAAQAFLQRHDLPQDYLETVAKYIIKHANLEGSYLPGLGGGFADPFTGGGRYVPGEALNSPRQRGRLEATMEYFPVKDYISLESINVKLLLGKLTGFNAAAPAPLHPQILELIGSLNPEMTDSQALEIATAITTVLPKWPADIAYPLFDLLRCLVRWPSASEAIFHADSWSNILRLSDLSVLLESSPTTTDDVLSSSLEASNCLLFCLRLLANAVALDGSRVCVASALPSSLSLIVRLVAKLESLIGSTRVAVLSNKKHHQVALATLLLNLSVFAHLNSDKESLLSALPSLRGLSGLCTRMTIRLLFFCGQEPATVSRHPPEVPLRLLSALGTAVVTSVVLREDQEAAVKLQRVRLIGSAAAASANEDAMAGWDRFREILVFWAEAVTAQPRVRECATALLNTLE